MKLPGILGAMLLFGWFVAIPAAGRCCNPHDHYCHGPHYDDDDCWDCAQHGCHGPQASRRAPGPSAGAAASQTLEGKIVEVVYLPGRNADSGMVEIRLESQDQTKLIRLAPAGFLKQGSLVLEEGDVVTVKGFPVTSMEGDLVVATEIHKGGQVLSLRDSRGQSAW